MGFVMAWIVLWSFLVLDALLQMYTKIATYKIGFVICQKKTNISVCCNDEKRGAVVHICSHDFKPTQFAQQ